MIWCDFLSLSERRIIENAVSADGQWQWPPIGTLESLRPSEPRDDSEFSKVTLIC